MTPSGSTSYHLVVSGVHLLSQKQQQNNNEEIQFGQEKEVGLERLYTHIG